MNTLTTEDHEKLVECSCGNRFKRIAENLYECLTKDSGCDNKFAFGSRYFCSWLMYPRKDRSEQNFPCLSDAARDNKP